MSILFESRKETIYLSNAALK